MFLPTIRRFAKYDEHFRKDMYVGKGIDAPGDSSFAAITLLPPDESCESHTAPLTTKFSLALCDASQIPKMGKANRTCASIRRCNKGVERAPTARSHPDRRSIT